MTTLDARGLGVGFAGRAVLHGVDFAAAAGEMVGLLGPNAAGKTTLVRVLAGLIAPAAGTVEIDGVPAAALARIERARRIAYLEQGAACHWPLTAARLVALGRLPHLGRMRRPGARDRAAVARALAACEVTHLAHRPVTALSGGEQARVMLARALAGEPALLLADEPVSQLDPYHQFRVMELLRAIAERGGAVVVVLHDLALAARFCDRLVLMQDGRIAADGPPRAVLTPEVLARVFAVRAAFVEGEDGPLVVPSGRIETPAGRRGEAGP